VSYLTARYDPWVVIASIAIAVFAAYVTLDLAKRVRSTDAQVARGWWAAGSLTMGSGIWSMHFTGMLAFSLPGVPLGYGWLPTVLSWAAAVGVSGIALWVASHGRLRVPRLAFGAAAMGAGICAMHYTGMHALDVAPGITWSVPLVAASAAIAVGASAVALLIFFWLRTLNERQGTRYQVAAAVLMGLAISGMHYTGMAAAEFAPGTVCLSAGQLAGGPLGSIIVLATVLLLAMTLCTSLLDARMQTKTTRLATSLSDSNAKLQSAVDELQRHAFIDALTGLPNRLLFEDRLAHAAARHKRSDGRSARATDRLAVFFIDLDGFKAINESLGHAAGDEVLRQAAERLRAHGRESDTLARVGGDEFLLLIEDAQDGADAVVMARRLLELVAMPYDVAGQRVEISTSIGIVLFPDQADSERLVAHADAAMRAAKRAGGNTCVLFEARMDEGASEQLNLQNDLRHAIERGELSLHYQPKIDARHGRVCGVEALLRWHHPQRGAVGPALFIPIAERFGLIHALGDWVIDEACRQMRAWSAHGLKLRVAINLSARQLTQHDLAERIRGALERNGISPSRLCCEITESVAMDDLAVTQRAFDALVRLGVQLSIDDFGTGHSSLAYLRKLPATQLKIDRTFVKDVDSDADARAIVDAVVHLAHALGLRVVAEGVETEAQREVLLELGGDELQGYLIARPMPAVALLEWLQRHEALQPVAFEATAPVPIDA
jgi:diguanylate cyclase (GGDEF)-like protein